MRSQTGAGAGGRDGPRRHHGPWAALLLAATVSCGAGDLPSSLVDAGTADSEDRGRPGLVCEEDHPARTVGLLRCTRRASAGYTLILPTFNTNTYLIDMRGQVVHSWHSDYPAGQMGYLLEDGTLLRAALDAEHGEVELGGVGGRIQILAWDSTVLWDYKYCEKERRCQHHDVVLLPNGNVLFPAWEYRTRAQMARAGLDLSQREDLDHFWVDTVVEVRRTGPRAGEVVWKWQLLDHVVQDLFPDKDNYGAVVGHPERMDLNVLPFFALRNDLAHFNAIDYNARLDQIALSNNVTSEILIIDHGVTTAEARGSSGGRYHRGGDILYRWGNPSTYGAGGDSAKQLFSQHDVTWIPPGLPGAGELLTFSNGLGRPGGGYSTVEQIAPPVGAGGGYRITASEPFGPARPSWTFSPTDTALITTLVGGAAQRLPGGNTLITSSLAGRLVEVTPGGEVVWEYANPVNAAGPIHQGEGFPILSAEYSPILMNARRYAPDFAGLRGRRLVPRGYLELPRE